uniref:Uncharacterized protein n=1 Tax=Arundo donax TaxID=35708 RepID=A0A0A9FMN0_ARUDO
MLAHPAAR